MRTEFNERTKRLAKARAGENCENCGLPHLGRFHFDHHNPDGLTGKPTLENCKLLCLPCHKTKTAQDVARIAQAKRREAIQQNVKADKRPIPQRAKPEKAKRDQLPIPPALMNAMARRFVEE